jgi:hypothetical protein
MTLSRALDQRASTKFYYYAKKLREARSGTPVLMMQVWAEAMQGFSLDLKLMNATA